MVPPDLHDEFDVAPLHDGQLASGQLQALQDLFRGPVLERHLKGIQEGDAEVRLKLLDYGVHRSAVGSGLVLVFCCWLSIYVFLIIWLCLLSYVSYTYIYIYIYIYICYICTYTSATFWNLTWGSARLQYVSNMAGGHPPPVGGERDGWWAMQNLCRKWRRG